MNETGLLLVGDVLERSSLGLKEGKDGGGREVSVEEEREPKTRERDTEDSPREGGE